MSGREPAMPRPPGSGMPQAKDLVLLVVFLILGILLVLVLLVVLLLVRGRRVLVAVLLLITESPLFLDFSMIVCTRCAENIRVGLAKSCKT